MGRGLGYVEEEGCVYKPGPFGEVDPALHPTPTIAASGVRSSEDDSDESNPRNRFHPSVVLFFIDKEYSKRPSSVPVPNMPPQLSDFKALIFDVYGTLCVCCIPTELRLELTFSCNRTGRQGCTMLCTP